MNGAIVINKPAGLTSRDVVSHLNKILNIKQIGHTGTLDPMATGVLICLVGRATKLMKIMVNDDKDYIASFRLGLLTDTLDITGQILKDEKYKINKKELIKVINNFNGTYSQEVPLFSAAKVDGKRLHKYARENKDVELPKRDVIIEEIKLISIKKDIVTIKVRVSKGTYIRSLVRDIGEALGTYGTLTSLERTRVGKFNVKSANDLQTVVNGKHKFYTVKELLSDYPSEEIDPELLYKIKNGQMLDKKIKDYILFTFNNKEIALYEKINGSAIKPSVMFYVNK